MCRNCGALVGSAETSCSLCGAAKVAAAQARPQAPAAPAHDRETIKFARAILSRPYIFTIIFITANVFVYFLTSQAGADGNAGVLVRYGATGKALIDGRGEWWRFVTPIFLHGNVAHLLMNMYGLWVIGPYVERLYGSAKFVFFWVAAGIAGVVASYLSVQPAMYNSGALGRFFFKAGDAISVGASGALFGLIGVLFVFGIKFRRELPEGFKRAFGTGMLPTILLNIAIGVMIPVIDNAAHMGGLVAGALLALVVGYKRPGERAGVAVFWHILQAAALVLVIVSFVMVGRHFRETDLPPEQMARLTQDSGGEAANAITFLKALDAGEEAFVKAFNQGDASGVDAALKLLDDAPRFEEPAEPLRNDLKSLLMRIKEYATAGPERRKLSRERNLEKRKLLTDFQAWQKKELEWGKAYGAKYGIKFQEPDASKPDAPGPG